MGDKPRRRRLSSSPAQPPDELSRASRIRLHTESFFVMPPLSAHEFYPRQYSRNVRSYEDATQPPLVPLNIPTRHLMRLAPLFDHVHIPSLPALDQRQDVRKAELTHA
ncbi:hypothetical protein G7Z17_g12948 [Cylindrodendrum hubeiense]|uniref:Uncharacterized protein n=1 Tax=Cylindrodendrum hubeiense TaxID=595255 RepID=A0A9P5GUJ9_9HYPO|nr:hypothetical protein G7Z17_g12948 [Cylindrodendrum hubeiense]